MGNTKLTNEQVLQDFLLDINCLNELLPWTENFNIFDILKISRAEIRHSNMLAWLLNPNENHGLGDSFFQQILCKIAKSNLNNKHAVFNLLTMDLYDFSVMREWKNIDILLYSAKVKTVIAIENKIGAHEHDNQLARYQRTIENEFADYSKIFIFLTPDGKSPSDKNNWEILTYSDIAEILTQLSTNTKLLPEANLMIRNYIEIIRRDIVEDKELTEICNKIYNKHKKALDLIFEYRTDERMRINDAIKEILYRLSSEGLIIYDESFGCNFQTVQMNNYLPKLSEPISSYKTNDIYLYWFNVTENGFYAIFELCGKNVPKQSNEKMQAITAVLKPNDKKPIFEYKRVFATKRYNISANASQSDIERAAKSAVYDILNMEKQLFSHLEQE